MKNNQDEVQLYFVDNNHLYLIIDLNNLIEIQLLKTDNKYNKKKNPRFSMKFFLINSLQYLILIDLVEKDSDNIFQ